MEHSCKAKTKIQGDMQTLQGQKDEPQKNWFVINCIQLSFSNDFCRSVFLLLENATQQKKYARTSLPVWFL